MNQRIKNKNIHVKSENVYCYKLPEGYSKIFTNTGMYEIISQKIWDDTKRELTGEFKSNREFDNRWVDTILKKSYHNYYL